MHVEGANWGILSEGGVTRWLFIHSARVNYVIISQPALACLMDMAGHRRHTLTRKSSPTYCSYTNTIHLLLLCCIVLHRE